MAKAPNASAKLRDLRCSKLSAVIVTNVNESQSLECMNRQISSGCEPFHWTKSSIRHTSFVIFILKMSTIVFGFGHFEFCRKSGKSQIIAGSQRLEICRSFQVR